MSLRLLIWVGACWLGIFAATLIEWIILGYSLWKLFEILKEYGRGWAIAIPALTAVVVNLILVRLAHLQFTKRSREQHQDPSLLARLRLIEQLLAPLCTARRKLMPTVALMGPEDRLARASFGMVDQPFGTDFVIIHRDMPGVLTERQLTAILAHEMRHHNAFENWFTLLGRILRITLVLSALLTVLLLAESYVLGEYASRYNILLVWATILVVTFVAGTISHTFGNFRSQFVEFKTDALSVLESKSARDMISALGAVETIVNYEFKRLQIFTGDALGRWRIFSTHPPMNVRKRMLRWVYL